MGGKPGVRITTRNPILLQNVNRRAIGCARNAKKKREKSENSGYKVLAEPAALGGGSILATQPFSSSCP
jgi:hypothetical protein